MLENAKKVDIIIIAVILLLIAGGILLALLPDNESGDSGTGIGVSSSPKTVADYNGKNLGIVTGSSFEQPTLEFFPDSTYLYFNSNSDIAAALVQGKIDGFIGDEPTIHVMAAEQTDIGYLPDMISVDDYAFGFGKNERGDMIRGQFNEMLAELNSNGTLEIMKAKWLGQDDAVKTVDLTGFSGENGVLNVVTASTDMPFSYIKDNQNAGLSIELVETFCHMYGYTPKIEDVDFSARIPGLVSGMYDMCASSLAITEERKESISFSDTFYKGGLVLAVRASDIVGTSQPVKSEQGFLESIADSFEKNFIRENRWQLIVDGIGTTCLITVLSALFGSVLAFLICMFRRTGSKLANAISNIYVKLLQGTPIVVLLMILYYVVLGKSGLEAVWVAIISFTLNFGAYASEIMRSGIESIDGGQREAALALGYNENQAFFRFIFPQAAVRFLPVYNGEIVSLLKSTSIVGYIAIQDLTKMSDIIRSRTYEAFFPLIATAIIYFILAWIISLILKFILKKVSPKRKRGATK